MIKYSFGRPPFARNVIWFADRISMMSCFSLCIYRQCRTLKYGILFKVSPFHTIHIDLSLGEDQIFNGFAKNTRYEVRRSDKDDVSFRIVDNLDEFVEFYASFARSKGRDVISREELNGYGGHLVVTAAVHNGVDLVMHSYLVDKEASVVRLLHSASDFRSATTNELKSVIGRANRRLHWMDMQRFKADGFSIYDFGGFAVNHVDDELAKINEFKRGFGGEVVEQYEYTSMPLVLALGLRRFIYGLGK